MNPIPNGYYSSRALYTEREEKKWSLVRLDVPTKGPVVAYKEFSRFLIIPDINIIFA